VAYKQPITAPEVMEIRGVQGAGVLKTLIDRRLIAPSGRKNVVGKPILYKTTKEFLIQFGLKDVSELPTLKEFEELSKFALGEPEPEAGAEREPRAELEPAAEPQPAAKLETPAEQQAVAEAQAAAEQQAGAKLEARAEREAAPEPHPAAPTSEGE
jgi:segregation and condensation protein B